jgi:prepilin-type N-terminal cleavage/methylation domain-containing protein
LKNPVKKLKQARVAGGFTLLEVMIAVGIFCAASFAIFGLVSQSIATARRLQRPMVDAGLVASELSLTNKCIEGRQSGTLAGLLGPDYKGYTWTSDVVEERTNRLFRLNIQINRNGADRSVVSEMSILFYRPDSPPGSADGGLGIHP